MEIYGREVGFRLTVGAAEEISKFCSDGDIQNVDTIISGGNTTETMKFGARMVVAMSKGYESAKAFEENRPLSEINPVTLDEVKSLEVTVLFKLIEEALGTFHADRTPTVEVEPAKKEEATAEGAENPAP